MESLGNFFVGAVFGMIPGIYIGIKIAIKEYKNKSDWWKKYADSNK